jgi:hypothetical protein
VSRRQGREKGRSAERCGAVGGSMGAGDGPRHGLDVFLAGLVVEILDAPF